MDIFKIIGTFGLILIIIGILIKQRNVRDILFILGGLSLTAYSINIKDAIFIILQIIFTSAAFFDLIKLRKKKG